MTHPIIKTDNYLLVVDNESQIKEGERGLSINNAVYTHFNHLGKDYGKKIIYHLPLNDAPILEGVPLLTPLEEGDVEKLARTYTVNTPDNDPVRIYAFTAGYNKAKEKYKYTENDVRFAIKSAFMGGVERVPYLHQLEDNIIKALQQQYPIAFECEIETYYKPKINVNDLPYIDKPKTITNSQGLTQMVGKYIY